jgi:hypothetical protein
MWHHADAKMCRDTKEAIEASSRPRATIVVVISPSRAPPLMYLGHSLSYKSAYKCTMGGQQGCIGLAFAPSIDRSWSI